MSRRPSLHQVNIEELFYRTSKAGNTRPKARRPQNANYSFSEATSYIANKTAQVSPRATKKLPCYKPTTSLAEENMVRNFNKFTKNADNQDIPTNIPQRIELPLFFNTPNRIAGLRSRKSSLQPQPA